VEASAFDPDLASVGPQLAVDETQQRGLARAARAGDLNELAARNAEVDVGENGRATE
jgi:hypothetical protein